MISAIQCQVLKNTSYKNKSGERILRIEITLPVPLNIAWNLFTNDQKLKKWIAPIAHIELRYGGYIITNYDSSKSISDSNSIKLPIISFIDNELLILKVNLNGHFPMDVRQNDRYLQEIIQFKKIDDQNTKIISSTLGWGHGAEWDKTYDFFVKGNEWTYNELIKNYN